MSFHWKKQLTGRKRKKTLGQGLIMKLDSYRSALQGDRLQLTFSISF